MKIVSNSLDKFSILPPIGITVGLSQLTVHTLQTVRTLAVGIFTSVTMVYFKCRKLTQKVLEKQNQINTIKLSLLLCITKIAFDIIRIVPVVGPLILLKAAKNKIQNWKKEAAEKFKANQLEEALALYDLAAHHQDVSSMRILGKHYYDKKDFTKALYYLSESAKRKDAESQYLLADMHENGNGVEKSVDKALTLTKEAIKYGYPLALVKMGDYYSKGLPKLPQDYKKSFYYYFKAANKKIPEAQFKIGNMYFEGLGVHKDQNAAIKWLEKASQLGYLAAVSKLAEIASSKGTETDFTKAFNLHLNASKNGDAKSIYEISKMLLEGQGVQKNIELGISWMREAAFSGCLEAQKDLAKRYYSGIEVDQSDKEAYTFFLLAANNGDSYSQYRIGNFLSNGSLGEEKDQVRAMEWFKKAAEQGEFHAQYIIATNMLKDESNLTQDIINKALDYLTQSANAGYAKSLYLSGIIYRDGKYNVTKDLQKSFKLFLEAAENGHAKARSSVGEMYVKGIGTDQNFELGLKYINLAITDSEPNAIHNLGIMYLLGDRGVKKNVGFALKRFEEGVQLNYSPSIMKLAYLLRGQEKVKKDLERSHQLFLKAAQLPNPNPEALYRVGKGFLEGIGTDKSFEKAVFWLEKAVNAKYMDALHPLCLTYLELASNADDAGKIEFERKAHNSILESINKFLETNVVDSRYIPIQFMYASMLEEGIGTKKDKAAALEWYKYVAEQKYDGKNRKILDVLVEVRKTLGKKYEEGDEDIEQNDQEAIKWYDMAGDNSTCKFLSDAIKQKLKDAAKTSSNEEDDDTQVVDDSDPDLTKSNPETVTNGDELNETASSTSTSSSSDERNDKTQEIDYSRFEKLKTLQATLTKGTACSKEARNDKTQEVNYTDLETSL